MAFELNAAATKKDIIDQYEKLLEAYKKTVREQESSAKKLSALEKRLDDQAIATADDASVQSVIENIGRLRGQIGATLNVLNDQMTSQAGKLEEYKRAVAAQEARLKEYFDIENAADALAKLTAAYEERSKAAQSEFETRVAEMAKEHGEKKSAMERELNEQRQSLESAIAEQRAKWLEEKDREKKQRAEDSENQKKEREREEAEYVYQRDRARKLEQDDYEERKKTLERELSAKQESSLKNLDEREAFVRENEKKLKELEKQAAEFPTRLQNEISASVKRAVAEITDKYEQKVKLAQVDREWEKKMLEQQIEHLKSVIDQQEKKSSATEAELTKAQAQVNEVAKKAIEGAALNKAFQSVNQIALEQARHPDKKSQE